MIARLLAAVAMLGAAEVAHGEAMPSARALFEGAWKQSECNQQLETALNNARYDELDGGYSLGMVLCWLGPRAEAFILFLVAPKTAGRPQLIRFDDWRDGRFEPEYRLPMAKYHAETKTITSDVRFSGSGRCGAAGDWAWTGSEFKMTGYWYKPKCDDEEFEREDRYRVFPPRE